jgi:hypothetical protein
MRFTVKAVASLAAVLFYVTPGLAEELYIYPAGGQSAEQMDKDKHECYKWAKNDTGFDPMAAPTTTSAPPEGQKKSGGVVKGGLAGAATGAIIGDNRKATRRGAAAGGLIGGVRQSSHNTKVDQSQQQWEQQEASNYANQRNNYNRAYSACLEGRGYTVK